MVPYSWSLGASMKVFVYYNLHKRKWSVRALEGPDKDRVIAHKDELYLRRPVFKVSEAGRQRVLQERRKNVHAGVVGEWELCYDDLTTEVTYNPYKYSSFVVRATEQPIASAAMAKLSHRKVYI
jgi:hypothetical protein